jgi:hypothetical protein
MRKSLLALTVTILPPFSPVTIVSAAYFPAVAHEHKSAAGRVSWYPHECCHDGDCRPVMRVRSLRDGFLMTTEDGMTLFIGSQLSRRQSLDNRWHVCVGVGEYPPVVCVFEPPGS